MPFAGICEQTRLAWRYAVIYMSVCCSLITHGFFSSAMSPAEVTEKLGLHRMRDRSWYVHPRLVVLRCGSCLHYLTYLDSCATTGEGLFEGLQWLSQNVKKRQP